MKGKILGSLEAKIMECFWCNDCQLTISKIISKTNLEGKLAYTTVATVVNRLVKKGLLSRHKLAGDYLYMCQQTREEFMERRSRTAAAELLSSYGDFAISSFVKEVKSSPKSFKKLQEFAL